MVDSIRDRMTEVLRYEKKLGDYKRKLIADCPHDDVKFWPEGSGASYYDKAEYWYNLWCADCRKVWSVKQDADELSKFKKAERVLCKPLESL